MLRGDLLECRLVKKGGGRRRGGKIVFQRLGKGGEGGGLPVGIEMLWASICNSRSPVHKHSPPWTLGWQDSEIGIR